MYLDAKKAHMIPKCDHDVYVQLPLEAGAQPDECGKLLFWLFGCRPSAESCSFGSTVAVQLRRPGRSITRRCSVRLASRG